MDGDTMRSLRTLPDDLVSLGWRFVPTHLRPSGRMSGKSYRVVYERPHDPDIDDRSAGCVVRAGHFHVEARSWESWDAARQSAIETMRAADAKRRTEGLRGE